MTYIFGMNRITKDLIPKIVDAKDTDIVKGANMPTTPFGQGTRATFSFWVYLNDMNYRYGQNKSIFYKKLPGGNIPSMELYIGETGPNVYLNYKDSMNPDSLKTVEIGVLPLKKWQHFTIVQEANLLDVFMNGRIAFTSDPAVQVLSTHGEDVTMSREGGWSGFRSKLEYSNYNLRMIEIRSKLDAGPLEMSWMNPLFYLYWAGGYILKLNDRILTYFLPDPEKAAEKALKDQQTANANAKLKQKKDTTKCPVSSDITL